ncbi:MAG: twin-arginine translocase TatA/TatE family subunit [Dehalococcoidia bacterium]|nr:twin-arginine translocase TatA/TatE family subunit [Dehalococcoidia bacterium]
MDFLGMGTLEILVVLLIAMAVFGPERMVDIARKLGRFVRNVTRVGSELTKTLSEENLPKEEKKMVQDIKKIGTEFRQSVTDAIQPIGEASKQVKQVLSDAAPVSVNADSNLAPPKPDFTTVPQNKPVPPTPKESTESKQ